MASDRDLRLIRVSKEDETVGINAGLWACNRRALILIQNTGFLDSINAIRCIGVEYRLPICMMVGLLEKEPDRKPTESGKFELEFYKRIAHIDDLIESDDDVGRIVPAIHTAYETSLPVALLIGRSPGA